MSTNVPYHLSNHKPHTMSTISPNLLQTACNVYDLPQPATVCIQYLQSSPTNNRLHTIATNILNQQQTACNVHNLTQPTTYNIQCPQTSPSNCRLHSMSTIILKQLHTTYNVHNRLQPTTDCIQCLQSVITNYRWHKIVKTPRFPRSTDRMQCQQTHPPNHGHCSPISPTISSTINGIQSHDSFSSISPNIPPTIDCIHFPHSLPTAPHIPHKLPMHVYSSIIANYRGNTMTTISPNHSSNYICMQFRQSFKIFLKLHTA